MALLVADTSGLVSVGTASWRDSSPFDAMAELYTVTVPALVVEELEETAAYDDVHGVAAGAVLDRLAGATVVETSLDAALPLDDGENAAVTTANARSAELLLCDEFTELPLVHASLEDTRLVTTPTLLRVLHRRGVYSAAETRDLLDRISEARSWGANSYVRRVRDSL